MAPLSDWNLRKFSESHLLDINVHFKLREEFVLPVVFNVFIADAGQLKINEILEFL